MIKKNLENNKKQGVTKILKNSFKYPFRTIDLKSKKGILGNMKYLPSFSKE
jgi:hypothetical protein